MKVIISTLMLVLASCAFGQEFVIEHLTDLDQFQEAIDLAHSPDGRIFIAERNGEVNVWENGVTTEILALTTNTSTEQGLLGIAVHPGFTTEGWVYVFYTNGDMTFHNIDRFWVDINNQVSQHENLLSLDPILGGFHNGGAILFHNGYLFVSSGDSQQPAQSQELTTYRGKILRLNEDGTPAAGNPYENAASVQQQSIWAVGFRNPWRMYSDPVSGRLFVIDVGTSHEEMNEITAPDPLKNYNYAWGHNQGGDGYRNNAQFIDPFYSYPTGSAEGCAVTNGILFNTSTTSFPDSVQGQFLFNDWCRDELRVLNIEEEGSSPFTLYDGLPGGTLGLSIGQDGNLYFVNFYGTSPLYRLKYENTSAPQIVNQPLEQEVMVGNTARFSVTAIGANPLTYQWKKNGIDIPNENSAELQINVVEMSDSGVFSVQVTNDFGQVISLDATLDVIPFNAKPNVSISSSFDGVAFIGGDVIDYSGSATDPEDGIIPADKLSWEIQLWHADTEESVHWHPGPVVPDGVSSGSFVADNQGEKSPNIWFMLILKAVDSNGNEGRDTLEFLPRQVNLTAETDPAGLEVLLSVVQNESPVTTKAIPGTKGLLTAPRLQVQNGKLYEFAYWLDGGEASKEFTVPDEDKVYRAVYQESSSQQLPFGTLPHHIPGRIEAEEYDLNGQDTAFNDLTVGNAGGQFRTGNVDIELCNEGGYSIGWVDGGEWLEYTVEVESSGFYQVVLRQSSPYDNRTVSLLIDEKTLVEQVAIPNTGAWQNWVDVTIDSVPLSKGVHEFRWYAENNNQNFNRMDFLLQEALPEVDFEVNGTDFCENDTAFIDIVASNDFVVSLGFGAGVIPSTVHGFGTHEVQFLLPGQHSMTVIQEYKGAVFESEIPNVFDVSGLPDPLWSVFEDQVECLDTTHYLVYGQENSSYFWEFPEQVDFVESDGHGQNHNHVSLSFLEMGGFEIAVTEIDQNGCAQRLDGVVDVSCLISALSEGTSNELFIQPNPATDFVQFYGVEPQEVEVEVYDLSGVRVKELCGFSSSMDVKSLPRGLYIFKVILDGEARGLKVMLN